MSKNLRFISLILSAGLSSCVQPSPEHISAPIDQQTELVELARSHLDEVAIEQEWLLGATEVAKAMKSSGMIENARSLLNVALSKALHLQEAAPRASVLLDVTKTMIEVDGKSIASSTFEQIASAVEAINDQNERWDLTAKLAANHALNGEDRRAEQTAAQIPSNNETHASYKARALHDIAPIQAKQNRLEVALNTLALIDTGLVYYQVAARADVAMLAYDQDKTATAKILLSEADTLRRLQTDGYFVAGALRHIADAFVAMGNHENASIYFAEALEAARTGSSPQHRARAVSRVATSLADAGRFDQAAAAIPEAVQIANSEPRETFRYWAFYEIAGAAAFSGDFSTAKKLLAAIPASFKFGGKSLKAVTQRDVAWGLARHQRQTEAVELALQINSARERVQALSRIVRVNKDPKMKALPRYL